MKTLVKRAGAIALLAVVVGVPGLAGMVNCLPFISSSGGDKPLTGYLTGESSRTTTKVRSWSYTNFGGTFNGSSTVTDSYSVGYYRMSNGTLQQIRCDSYTYV
jgi:hypothetical protein